MAVDVTTWARASIASITAEESCRHLGPLGAEIVTPTVILLLEWLGVPQRIDSLVRQYCQRRLLPAKLTADVTNRWTRRAHLATGARHVEQLLRASGLRGGPGVAYDTVGSCYTPMEDLISVLAARTTVPIRV